MLSGISRCDLPILYWRSVGLRNSSDDRPVGALVLLERIDVRDTAKGSATMLARAVAHRGAV
jgi:hypothetical protein